MDQSLEGGAVPRHLLGRLPVDHIILSGGGVRREKTVEKDKRGLGEMGGKGVVASFLSII